MKISHPIFLDAVLTGTVAPSFQDVQNRVSTIIRNKILVGHCLWKFLSVKKSIIGILVRCVDIWPAPLKVLGISHPAIETRDLALFLPLRERLKQRSIVDLSTLMHYFMGRNVGLHYEDSVR